jgi:hypothetical protein
MSPFLLKIFFYTNEATSSWRPLLAGLPKIVEDMRSRAGGLEDRLEDRRSGAGAPG